LFFSRARRRPSLRALAIVIVVVAISVNLR
jgi:hypothetical protein